MIGELLQDPTIDKLNFLIPPGMYGMSSKAVKLFEDDTSGQNTRFRNIYNDPDKHIYSRWNISGYLKIDSNPNNIGDPADIRRAYRAIGIELPDTCYWELSGAHIERHQKLGMPAFNYTPVLSSSVNPRNTTYLFNNETFTVYSDRRKTVELQFYDKAKQMKSVKGISIPPNTCRLEVRFKKSPLSKLGIRTATDLYEIGPAGWLSLYKSQFDRLLPSLRLFAGEDPAATTNSIDELVDMFDASFIHNQSKEKGKRGRNVVLNTLIDVAFRSGDIGSLGNYNQLEHAYLIASKKHNVDRRVRSYDLKILKQEYINSQERQRRAGSYMQQTARELLTYVA